MRLILQIYKDISDFNNNVNHHNPSPSRIIPLLIFPRDGSACGFLRLCLEKLNSYELIPK